MCKLKYSNNWNQKLVLNIFADLRVYSTKNHYEGNIVDIEYQTKNGLIEFKGEIEKVTPVTLDKISESMWYMITGYNRENSLKIIHQMYKNKDIDIDKVFFAILIIRHRPDLNKQKAS